MTKQCFEGFNADNIIAYLNKSIAPTPKSSGTEIKVEAFTDSEELN